MRALRVASPSPSPGATPAARQSRFRGAPGTPPGFAHFVSLLLPPRRGQHLRPGRAGSAVFLAHPQAARTACRFSFPLAGGNTCGPAEPVPRCSWHTPRLRALRVAPPSPSPGATPAARQSRFRGVPGSPPGFAHFVSLLLPPCRGQRLRPGRAGSAVFLAHPQAARTACRFSFPLAGGNTCGAAEPVPRCSWKGPRARLWGAVFRRSVSLMPCVAPRDRRPALPFGRAPSPSVPAIRA